MRRADDSSDEEETLSASRKKVDGNTGMDRLTTRGPAGRNGLRNHLRPPRGLGGHKEQILEWLGRNNLEERRPKPRVTRRPEVAVRRTGEAETSASPEAKVPRATKRKAGPPRAINALKVGAGEVHHTAVSRRSNKSSTGLRRCDGHLRRSSQYSPSSSSEEVRSSNPKRSRASTPTPAGSPARSAHGGAGAAVGGEAITAADEGTFQAAVLERLRSLCGEHEDAKVLAEYIVVLVAGNKGREEMAIELKPFFQAQAQAESFVDWVEECKWKFLTGGPSPQKPAPLGSGGMSVSSGASPRNSRASAAAAAPPTLRLMGALRGESPPPALASRTSLAVQALSPSASSARSRLKSSTSDVFSAGVGKASSNASNAGSNASSNAVKPGPHVAVTSRVVLQPNPNFNEPASSAQRAGGRPTQSSSSSADGPPRAPTASAAGATPPKAATTTASRASTTPAAKLNKNELLESMTKQLQLILTKLNDKSLNDETREKYQALAQNVQMQMAKISRPQAPRRRP